MTNAKELKAIYEKISEHTSENEHGEAILALAKFSGDPFAVKYAQAAIKAHDIIGHLPGAIVELRKQSKQMARTAIVNKHGEDAMDMLEGAF